MENLQHRPSERRTTLSKPCPTTTIIRRHIEGAVSKSHSNDSRHAAAHQEPKKKNSIPSNDNSPTRAHSFRRLCGNCFCKTEQAVTDIVNISDAMARLLKPNRIGAARRQEGTFRSRGMWRIDPSEQSLIIYKALCMDCFSNYTGQASRKIATRIKDHRTAKRKECKGNSHGLTLRG